MTVDGKIATHNSSMKISGDDDLIRVHRLRKEYDGIMVGINTVLIDNPKLTIHKFDAKKDDNPVRIVVDSKARIPLESKVLDDNANTIVIVSEMASRENVEKLSQKCEIIVCGKKQVNLKESMIKLYDYGIKSILLEGGWFKNIRWDWFKDIC